MRSIGPNLDAIVWPRSARVPWGQGRCQSCRGACKVEGRASARLVPHEIPVVGRVTRTYDRLIKRRAWWRNRVRKPLLDTNLRVRVEAVVGSTVR